MPDRSIEEADSALGPGLPVIHGPVGIAAQFLIFAAIMRMKADADGSGRADLIAVEVKRLFQPLADPTQVTLHYSQFAMGEINSTNSSPLSRASISEDRKPTLSRSAILVSSRSPVAWP